MKKENNEETTECNNFLSNYVKVLAHNYYVNDLEKKLDGKEIRYNESKTITCPNIFTKVIFNKIKNTIFQPFINDNQKDVKELINTTVKYLIKSIDNFDKFIGFNSHLDITQFQYKKSLLCNSIQELLENINSTLIENTSILDLINNDVESTISVFNYLFPFVKFLRKSLHYDAFKCPNFVDILYTSMDQAYFNTLTKYNKKFTSNYIKTVTNNLITY